MNSIIDTLLRIIKENYKNKYWLIPSFLLMLWSIDTLVSLFNTGFVRMDLWVFVSIIFKCGIISCNLFFIINLFILKKQELYYVFKTYAGYCIIVVYVAYAFPRMSWEMADLITEVRAFRLWVFNFISTLFPFFLYFVFWLEKTQRAWGVETEKQLKEMKKKKTGNIQPKRKISRILIENLHVILQAFIIVILIQHFLFQLYVIPTESMVPSILTGDRPIVMKVLSGPAIPLTDWRLPTLKKPGRGDIVVFENPHYTQDSLFKKVFHHFVFLLTLSLVDIDRDEYGNVRKRFIVKRIIGEPGDKLKMIDDVVFIKRKTDREFHPLKEDQDTFAHINLYNESPETVKHIRNMVITRSIRSLLDRWDRRKNGIKISGLTLDISQTVTRIRDTLKTPVSREEDQSMPFINCQQRTKEIIHKMGIPGYDILTYHYFRNDIRRTNELEKENEMNVFHKYFLNQDTVQKEDVSSLSDYKINGKKLNLIYEDLVLRKFLRYCEFLFNKQDKADLGSDNQFISLLWELSELYVYIRYYDYRNFPQIPEGEENYIPEKSYFLMGDNRYNSLDFRFSQNRDYLRKMDITDPFSFTYPSSLKPYLLKKEKIFGIVAGRLWPLQRFGFIK